MAPKKVDTPEDKKAAMLAVQAVFDKYVPSLLFIYRRGKRLVHRIIVPSLRIV